MELQKNMIFVTGHQNMKKWEKELLYLKNICKGDCTCNASII